MLKIGILLLVIDVIFLPFGGFCHDQNQDIDAKLNDADQQILEDLKRIKKTLERLGKENFVNELQEETGPDEKNKNDPPAPKLPMVAKEPVPKAKPNLSIPGVATPPSRASEEILTKDQPPLPDLPEEPKQPIPQGLPTEPIQPPEQPILQGESRAPGQPKGETDRPIAKGEPKPPGVPEEPKHPILHGKPKLPGQPSPTEQPVVARTLADNDADEVLYEQTPAEPIDVRRKFLGHELKPREIGKFSRKVIFSLRHKIPTPDRKSCPAPEVPRCDPNLKYRSFDGTCNNLKNSTWGAYLAPYERFLKPAYEDGSHTPRGALYDERQGYISRLPSPRVISSALFESKNETDGERTHMLMQYGQFLDHDITRTTKEDLNCCDSKILLKFQCFNIDLVDDDYFYKNNSRSCMEFTRSNFHCSKNQEWWEQFNGVTAFIDGSTIYGSTADVAMKLRGGEDRRSDGKLLSNRDLSGFLPTRKECGVLPEFPNKDDDFVAGDERDQIHATLLSMHVMWLREHNRIAENLGKFLKPKLESYSPKDLDEFIFQETRKIVIAEHQNIVYNEFLPSILNDETRQKHHLLLERNSEYFSIVNPTVRSEFATVAFRYGHSQVQDIFKGRDQPWKLGRFYGDPIFAIRSNGDGFQRELEGACTQDALKVDRYITSELTNNLFNNKKVSNETKGSGSDLGSLNIQRGRDHGIPSYNAIRSFAGLSPISSMDNPPSEIPPENWEILSRVYRQPDDIDAYPAGLSETSLPGSILGPTLTLLVAEQFRVLKDGDRFFFTHTHGEASRGLPENLQNLIFQRTLGDIICGTSTIVELQKFVFRKASDSNPILKCDDPTRSKLNFEEIAKTILEDLNASANKTI